MLDLVKILEKTVSPSQADQNEAVKFIQDYIARDFVGFIRSLSDILFDQKNPPVARAAAGLQLKNQLTARDDALRVQQQDRWRSLQEDTRLYIKERVFRTLGTEVLRPSSVPQCVAYIGIVELPDRRWPGLIEALAQNVTSPASTPQLRLSSLETIGYICQDIEQSCLQPADSNQILTAAVSGITSGNYELMSASLQCLNSLLSWSKFNQDLIKFLCQSLCNYDIQLGQDMIDHKLAIMGATCDCLNVFLERKHSKIDSIDVRTSLFEDETNLHSIISTLNKLNQLPVQQDSSDIFEVEKKLCQVLTNIMRYVYVGPPEKPQNLLYMYSVMKLMIEHPSITVSSEAVKFWNRVFVLSPKRPNPSISDELTASLLVTCACKLIKAKYDSQLYGSEFECQQDFDNFQNKYRGEVCELCRNLTLQNDRICFDLVYSSIAKSVEHSNTNLDEWDALSSLAASVCGKLKDPKVYMESGVRLVRALMNTMDTLLQAASNCPDTNGVDAGLIANLVSSQLSCISALYAFLPYWHCSDKELTKELLRRLIHYAFHRPDKFISSSRQLVGNNTNLLNNEAFLKGFRLLSRHASASFVRVCLNHSRHLLDIFSYLKATIDSLSASVIDNPFSSERCQLYEGLVLICNEESNQMARKEFILELFESIKWFKDYELNCDQFIEFVGFNRHEAEQESITPQSMISQPIPSAQLNRVKLSYVISFLSAITRRLTSRETLLPEILNFVKPILNLMFTMHALWLPEMRDKCIKEYHQFLFAPFNNAYKQQILDTILVNQKTTSSNDGTPVSGSCDTNLTDASRSARGHGQYIELFSWNFYESLLVTMGAIIHKTSPDLYGYIDAVHLQTALTGADKLPPLKMHKLIKHFILPLVNTCSKDQHLIETKLLPLLTTLLSFLFEVLNEQWKRYHNDDEPYLNGVSDGTVDQNQILNDEMVQDQLLRNLSRDFIDLMNSILIEAVQPSEPKDNNNSVQSVNNSQNYNNQNSGPRQNQPQQDLYKIGRLGVSLLAAQPSCIKAMASTLTWSDSTLNVKTIPINQQLIKHIPESSLIKSIDEASMWLEYMFLNVITSLKMFGEHEQNLSRLLTLFLCLYEIGNKTLANFHDRLSGMTGVPKSAFQKFDEECAKSNEKNKRAALRKVLDCMIGSRVISSITR